MYIVVLIVLFRSHKYVFLLLSDCHFLVYMYILIMFHSVSFRKWIWWPLSAIFCRCNFSKKACSVLLQFMFLCKTTDIKTCHWGGPEYVPSILRLKGEIKDWKLWPLFIQPHQLTAELLSFVGLTFLADFMYQTKLTTNLNVNECKFQEI